MCIKHVMFERQKVLCENDQQYGYNFTFNCPGNDSTTSDDQYGVPEMDTHNSLHVIPYNASSDLIIDVSKYDFPKEIWYMIPTWAWVLKVSTFVPVILFGVIGNILLLLIIFRHKNLHTPTNLLIANMAVADILTLLICPAMFMIHDFYQTYHLGPVGCKLEGFLEGALLITGVLNLVAVSYDRLTAIVLPQETRLTLKGVKIVMLLTWSLGFAISLPLMIYRTYKERQWKNFVESYCSENYAILPMYWHVLISALVWFPLAVMMICYSAIFWKLDRYEANVLKREHPISVSYKTRVAKMLFIVLIVFILLRLPFTALIFIRNQMLQNSTMNQIDQSFQIFWYTSHYLIFLNAAVNPVIYGLTNDNYRRAYRQMPFLKCCCREPRSDKSLFDKKSVESNGFFNRILQPRAPCGLDDEKFSSTGRKWNIFNNNRYNMSDKGACTNTTGFENSTPSSLSKSSNVYTSKQNGEVYGVANADNNNEAYETKNQINFI